MSDPERLTLDPQATEAVVSELAVAGSYLEACKAWQEVINGQPLANKRAAGLEAMKALTTMTFHDTRKVIVGGEAAMYIPDGTSGMEEEIWPYIQFGELKTRGWLGRLYCVPINKQLVMTWPIYEPSVIGPVHEDWVGAFVNGVEPEDETFHLPIDEPLRRPLHFPVGLINYALPYAS